MSTPMPMGAPAHDDAAAVPAATSPGAVSTPGATATTEQTLSDDWRTSQAARARELVPGLAERGVHGVIAAYVDNAGIARVKSCPLPRLASAAARGLGMSPVFDAFGIDDSIAATPAGGPTGDLRLHPDLERLVPLPAQPGWAWAPADRWTQQGTPHPQCSRLLLRRILDRLAGDGLAFRAAVEIEWIVGLLPAPTAAGGRPATTPTDDFVPALAGAAYGAARIIELSDYLADLLAGLAAAGVEVEQLHPEYATGQFEVSVAPEDPIGAADTSVLVRHVIRATAARHGLRVSFAPKVLAGDAGNGGHLHLSAWRGGQNLFAAAGRSPAEPLGGEAAWFTGGILARLPALLALGAPGVASYLRLIPSHWAGAFAAWGLENRETALRLVRGATAEQGSSANLEIKCFDLAANPYLAFAGVLAAGAAGLRERRVPPPAVAVDPAGVPAADRERAGIGALPASLAEATAAFVADPLFTHVFGADLVRTVEAVRLAEIATFAGATAEEIVAGSRWRY